MPHAARPEGRRARKKRETRERILQAALDSFNSLGFEASTVEAISEAADVSKPTLFNYFPSKLALLQALLPEVDQRFARAITEAGPAGADVSTRLGAFFHYVATMTRRTPVLTSDMLVSALRAYEDRREGLSHHRFPETHAALEQLLAEGVRRGEVRTDLPVERMLDYITGIYVYGLLKWLANPEYSLEEELAEAVRFLSSALAGNPGQAAAPPIPQIR